MFISLFKLKKDNNKRLWIIILSAIITAFLLIGITMYLILGDNIQKGNDTFSIKDISMSSGYINEYQATVISNKTKNTYLIEEEYIKDETGKETFIIKTENELGDKIQYQFSDNSLKITSNSQISELILSDYIVKKTNVLSLSTFLSVYNMAETYIKNSSIDNSFKIEVNEYDNFLSYKVKINDFEKKELEEYNEIFNSSNKIKSMELLISKETYLPSQYLIYDTEEKVIIDIEYINFKFT